MAAYAALVSLHHVIDNLRLHSRPPITLHKEQACLLAQKLTFLQEFLQLYNPSLDYSQEADPLESRIASAAYAAEDAIESHIFDRLTNDGGKTSFESLYQDLEKVIGDMTLMEKEAVKIKETLAFQKAKLTAPAGSSISSSSSIAKIKSRMVGADGLLLEMKSRLTSNTRDLQTLPIVGMGGSGKTALALNIYHDGLIKEHFTICVWVTISQEYSIQEILIQLLTQLIGETYQVLGEGEGELGEMLHKHLYGRKYMVILDDMWSLKAWDGVKRFLPDNKNGSRIVVTTRLTTLALTLPNSNSLGMTLLSEDASWDLLLDTVFGEKSCCPLELEDIGKNIVRACKGLPLSIIVVGGLLAKSKQAIESWKYMEGNINAAAVNLEDDERCLKILYMSYKQLPVHLKPCFLYMGIYREDHVICISKLVKLWVSEGFLKPVIGKRPEDVVREYVKDLSDRNLIMIHKLGSIGSIKECKVHDLIRDLCLKEARKEGFYTIYPGHEIGNEMSRIVLPWSILERVDIPSAPLIHSFIMDVNVDGCVVTVSDGFLGLVRILSSYRFLYNKVMNRLVNSRLFAFTDGYSKIPSLSPFWNIHSLTIHPRWVVDITPPTDIWYMSNIRHLYCRNLFLPYPINIPDDIVLANLQSLGNVRDFMCSEQMVKRIPNIRKLEISCGHENIDGFCLTNLNCLHKLESLFCSFSRLNCLINYPQSLKKLAINISQSQCWKDMPEKIGELPLLEKLEICNGDFEGEWETSEGQFRSLKYLSLSYCTGLQVWTSEASHFPRLEHLRLVRINDLEEIPKDFADISTLRLIVLVKCSVSAVESARRILEEQEELYGEDETTLQVQVWFTWSSLRRASTSPNFHVTAPPR